MTRSAAGCGLLLLLSASCGSPLSDGVTSYEAGRASEALRQFRAIESDGACDEPEQCARYALFRGLAHLTLGDAEAAERWLMPLKRHVEARPRLLSTSERSRLLVALGSMGHLPGD
jgi:hypothetical protein